MGVVSKTTIWPRWKQLLAQLDVMEVWPVVLWRAGLKYTNVIMNNFMEKGLIFGGKAVFYLFQASLQQRLGYLHAESSLKSLKERSQEQDLARVSRRSSR